MHFTILYVLSGEELDNVSLTTIENDFCDRFCYCCGESIPRYEWLCDWFQIGGRWNEPIVATRGYVGERSHFTKDEPTLKDHYAIAEIKDITEPLDKSIIYAIATRSRVYQKDDDKYHTILNSINNKSLNGVIALIDCHD